MISASIINRVGSVILLVIIIRDCNINTVTRSLRASFDGVVNGDSWRVIRFMEKIIGLVAHSRV